jgi:hypothetical protein
MNCLVLPPVSVFGFSGGVFAGAAAVPATALAAEEAADWENEEQFAKTRVKTKKAHLHPRDIRVFLQILFRGPSGEGGDRSLKRVPSQVFLEAVLKAEQTGSPFTLIKLGLTNCEGRVTLSPHVE